MTLLEDLYYGNIQPSEYEQSPEVKRKLSAMTAFMENLIAESQDPQQSEKVEKLWSKQTELIALCERDAYLAGFRLGVRMMIDILT